MAKIKISGVQTLFAVAVIVGFIAGAALSIILIWDNMYFQFSMLRIAAETCKSSLNQWVLFAIMFAGYLAALWILVKSIWVIIVSKIITVNVSIKKHWMWWLLSAVAVLYCTKIALSANMSSILYHPLQWAISRNGLAFFSQPRTIILIVAILVLIFNSGKIFISVFNVVQRRWVHVLSGLLLTVFAGLNTAMYIDDAYNTPAGPNIILIIVDTLRADRLGCYGYTRNTTPNIDTLATQSVVLKNAFSVAPWTTPSIASIFTAQYPETLNIAAGTSSSGGWGFSLFVDEKFLFLSELLKDRNYKTHGIISHNFISSELGFDQGFDVYDQENAKGHMHISSPSITEKTLAFLKRNKKNKFFLYLHYFDPHYSYQQHDGYSYSTGYQGSIESGIEKTTLNKLSPFLSPRDITHINSLYDSEINFTDEHIGKLITELKEMGIYDNSLIVFTADHGEGFAERDSSYIGHSTTVYQELIHVPLIIKKPFEKKMVTIEKPVSLINLMPTIASYAGIDLPEAYNNEGTKLYLDDPAEIPDFNVISETRFGSNIQALIRGDWKLISFPQDNPAKKLFNLKKDPMELTDLSDENPSQLKELQAILNEWNMREKAQHDVAPPQNKIFSGEERNKLRGLGYLE